MPRARICLSPDLANLIPLELFIRSCLFLDEKKRNRFILIATEFFDNIVRYSESKFASPVCIDVRMKVDFAEIRLRYGTRNFTDMIKAIGTTEPYYDTALQRYRGLGLRMCGNLASSIAYKKGLFKSSIIIIL